MYSGLHFCEDSQQALRGFIRALSKLFLHFIAFKLPWGWGTFQWRCPSQPANMPFSFAYSTPLRPSTYWPSSCFLGSCGRRQKIQAGPCRGPWELTGCRGGNSQSNICKYFQIVHGRRERMSKREGRIRKGYELA